jgi:hypothetical protein
MTALHQVAGIIDGTMTIAPEPDGRVSFRVLIGTDRAQAGGCGRIELIIDPEHVRQALAGPESRGPAGSQAADEPPAFPCHIGFSHDNVNPAP